ncbi:hypothetical protein ACTFIU_005883 [Dictyostelium citrinum]
MEHTTTNKKLKLNLSDNKNNDKIIILPLIIQKQILFLLYEEYDNFETNKYKKFIKKEIINYSLVDWNWFKYCQKLFNDFFPHIYFNNNNIRSIHYSNIYKHFKFNNSKNNNINYSNNNNINNKYKLIYSDLIKTIIIDYFDINNESIDYINNLKSLETINVRCLHNHEYLFSRNSIWVLTYLNKLNNKDLDINFKLELGSFDLYETTTDLEHLENEEFTFKTNEFKVQYDFEYDITYGFVYEMIKELNPKFLIIKALRCVSDTGESHFQQYHSISKLNQNYESVKIINDFIPLYALYRFLQAPNLHTLKFDLQFHFLSKIYDDLPLNNNNNNDNSNCNNDNSNNNNNNNNNNDNNNSNNDNSNCSFNRQRSNDKIELDFNKMDSFKFIDFGNGGDNRERVEFIVHDGMKYYIDNGINEDNQIYCSYSRQENSCLSIPPYSNSLWNECLSLLSTNSTITDLSISHNCGGDCYCGPDRNYCYNERFINDFMNSFANNKTIKTLSLNFNLDQYGEKQDNIDLINKSIASMLDQNTTLESISIGRRYRDNSMFREISNLTKNTKCKIILFKD